jgi:uncharacterized membrane protein
MWPAFSGAIVLTIAATWIIARWLYKRSIVSKLPDIAKGKIAERDERIEALEAKLAAAYEREHELMAAIRGVHSLTSVAIFGKVD